MMYFLGNTCSCTIVMCLYACVGLVQVGLTQCKSLFATDEQIVVANRGVRVPVGRSVYLTSDHLQLRVNSADRCVVTVLDSDPLAQRPGRLTPLNFPCSFRPMEVAYTHLGAPHPGSDTVRLQLRYDYFHETVIIPFSLNVTVTQAPFQIVARNQPLKVDKLLGTSNPISTNTTEFSYNRASEQCKISLRPLVSGQPRYGEIVGDLSKLQMMDCDEFLQLGLKYRHVAQSNSPNRDYVPLVVHTLDKGGKITGTEYFHILVRIVHGKDNEKPFLETGSKLSLEVDQLLLTVVRPDILSARDAETPSDFLLFSFVKPMNSGDGYFINTDDRNRQISTFYQRDVRELKIAYVPKVSHSSVLPRTFYIDTQITDGDGAVSVPFKLKIVVRPMNALIPRVVTNRGLQLFEGQSKIIHAESNFHVVGSGGSLDRAHVYVADGLRHGHLTLPDNRKYFTLADLRAGAIAYQHDDSDSFSDNIIFKITDGSAEIHCFFPVWIFPQDDEPPILNVNTGLEISKNNMAKITSLVLSASDRDSDVSQLRYVLEVPISEEGVILKRQVQMPENPEDWELKNGMYEQHVEEFTQGDVLHGLIFYKHIGPHRTDYITDIIRFHIVDTGDPPNRSGVKELAVKIEPVDDIPPYLYLDTSLVVDVVNYQVTELKKKFIRYTDDDTEDRDIWFNITSLPADTYANTAMTAGSIVACEDHDKALTSFSQGQINHREICYKPPDEDSGLTSRVVQIRFDVEDANGNILKDQKLSIVLHPISSPPPNIRNSGVIVPEGGAVTLTLNMLDAVKADAGEDVLEFVLSGPPRHGQLKKKSKVMGKGDAFTRKNLRDGDIVYDNDSETIGDDLMVVDIIDGVHRIPVRVRISVRATTDERPSTTSGSDTLKLKVQVDENKSSILPLGSLRSTENDWKSAKLVLERAPYDGIIRRGEVQTTEFSLSEAMSGLISYQHTGGEVGLTGRGDYFQIAILSPKKPVVIDGRKISKIFIQMEILPVDNQPPIVTIGAPFEVNESKKSPILPRHVDASDTDSEDAEILCLIISHPKVGYFENNTPPPGSETPRTGIPISSFTIREIRQSAVNYVQSVHKGSEPRNDAMSFKCSDGSNQSPEFRFDIRITPYNDEYPDVELREFTVVEGGNMRIDSQILKVTDGDVPSDKIAFLITAQPKHGKIVRQTREGSFKIQSFSVEDISGESTIAYEHDGGDTLTDSFTFDLTDGTHQISKTVPIKIFPIDDEPPNLVVNNGLQIAAGESSKITNKVLRAEDPDSKVDMISFYVRTKPKYGTLRYIQGSVAVPLTQNSTFTQKDIDKRKIEYVHTDKEGLRDLIKLDISDGVNSLMDRHFYITVEGVGSVTPKIFNIGLQLSESGSVAMSTEMLKETDLAASSSDVTFSVTRAPSRGRLEFSNRAGISISSFSLVQLAENKVIYVYVGEEENRIDTFEFVEGKAQNVPAKYTFRVLVSDANNKKPVLMYQSLHVKVGDNRPLTSADLKAEDIDTPPPSIVFTVSQIPSRGVLLHNVSRVRTSFTMAELNEGLISYQHDGSHAKEDKFAFTVTDGAHSDFFVYPDTESTSNPQTLFINIVPDESGAPQINVNKGASYLTKLAGGHLGFTMTNRVLSIEDREIPEDSVFYTAITPPKWGYIINRAIGNRTIHSWTQGDINRQLIEYILRPGVNATSDSFIFNISDKVGNILVNQQTFHLNWAWISLDTDNLVVNETEVLNVTIRRRGHLGEMASVSIQVINGTARYGEDFSTSFARQVQFSPGQTEKIWRLRLLDDTVFEKLESFELRLTDPVSAVLDQPDAALVTIQDLEDESFIFFTDRVLRTSEKIGDILIPIKRVGDSSEETTVTCSTVPGTATGTFPTSVTSSDFVPRPADHTSVITFNKGEKESHCRVTIVDDPLNEEAEAFSVVLSEPSGGQLGKISALEIFIEPDMDDVPVIFFANSELSVDESDGFVEIPILRSGSDLSKASNVTVRSRKSDPKTADAGQDYIAVNNVLEFAPGETTMMVRVTILDDVSKPRMEGPESFLVQLRSPMNGQLGDPHTAEVTITDSESDLPSVQFKEGKYDFPENGGKVQVVVFRTGDVNHESAVYCHTKPGTAKPGADYVDKPANDASLIFFHAGDHDKKCEVTLVDDALYEERKHFTLHLSPAANNKFGSVKVGPQGSTTVTIQDEDDHPVIKMSDTKYIVREPMFKGEISRLQIPVLRLGDLSQTVIVTVNTMDDTAFAGADYTPIFTELVFGSNEAKKTVELEILFDEEKETRETFTVHLRSSSGIVRIENSLATVHIEERSRVADISFPDIPIVMSLRDYDRPESVDKPIQGYPIICVTPCNPKHPSYENSMPMCDGQGIDDSLTMYRWRASSLTNSGGVTKELYDVESNTFFTSTKSITLDSIYFSGGSRVQCLVRAVNKAGDPGQEQESELKTINPESGVCEPRSMDSITSEPFTARIKYTGSAHPTHPRKIKISITIPHFDGVLPLFASQKVTDFNLALRKPGAYIESHKLCSSLMNFNPVSLRSEAKINDDKAENFPYPVNAKLRSEQTLQFYKNLDLKTCLWNYEKYFDFDELITKCGGHMTVDRELPHTVQSYVSLNIPLYMSYIFHSPVADNNWLNLDLPSELHLAFTYDTPMPWDKGINNSDTRSGLEGLVYPKSIVILDDGQLSVTFETAVKFNGRFLAEHPDSGLESSVKSPDHPSLTFHLRLKELDSEMLQDRQIWNFVSDVTTVKDFTGNYVIRLVPCTVALDPKFNQPASCSPQMPLTFNLPIRIQQVSDFVPARYSGNTHFYLTRRKELWLSENKMDITQDSDVKFNINDRIYAKVAVDLVQNLAHSYNLTIEKVFLCSGKDGYIPKYDPNNDEYGCLPGNPNLQYTMKILDKNSPTTTVKTLHSVNFRATLAYEDSALSIRQSGDDGFSLDSLPIYQKTSKSQWYLQAIYSIKSRNSGRGSWTYSALTVENDLSLSKRFRRAGDDSQGIGVDGRGTNIIHIKMDYFNLHGGDAHLDASLTTDSDIPLLPIIIAAVALVLIIVILAIALFIRQRRKHSPPSSPNSTITIIKNGHAKVMVTPQHYQKRNMDV